VIFVLNEVKYVGLFDCICIGDMCLLLRCAMLASWRVK